MALSGVVLAVVFAAGGGGGLGAGGRIAVLEVNGAIDDDRDFLKQLREHRENASIRGFVISINSPGGVVAPSQSIYGALRELREEDERPIVAVINGLGASGGYYVALGADSIFALPGSLTGSIGVIMEMPDASGLMEKVGVRMQTVQSAEHKDVGSPFRPLSEGDRALLQSLVQDVYEQFVAVVVQERSLPDSTVRVYADGRILSGRQALAAGLVDRLGNIEDAIDAAGRMADLGRDPRVAWPKSDRATLLDVFLGSNVARGVMQRLIPERIGGATVRYQMPW